MKEKKMTRFPYSYTTSLLLVIIKAPLHLCLFVVCFFFSLISYPSNPSFFFNLIFKTSGREGSRQNDSREWCWEAMSCQCRNCVLSDEVHNSLSSLLNPAHSCSFCQYHSFKSSLSLLWHDFTQTFHCLENLGQAMHCIAIFKNHAAFSSLHQLSKTTGKKKMKLETVCYFAEAMSCFSNSKKVSRQ